MAKLTVEDLHEIKEKAKMDIATRLGQVPDDVSIQEGHAAKHLLLCGGTGCHATGSIGVKEALLKEIKKQGKERAFQVIETGCNGFCAQGPVMVVQPDGIFYQKIQAKDAAEIVEQHLINGEPVKRLLYKDPSTKKRVPLLKDIPFFSEQQTVVLRNKGLIDPEEINDYIARDGYQAAAKALLEMGPKEIIEEVKTSGLRGRGGAGFPTGLKWQFAGENPGDIKYVLCNADEGDPGAFMDRSVLEADPHAVVEGMIIAGKAIGAHEGRVYCRAEYPLAVRRLGIAIEKARDSGLLGKDILGSGFDFDLEIYQGAGAFVCGEETALMKSIEGQRGMPRPRPPFPAQEGLWKRPTVLNNVETYANVPQIILKSGEWYAGIGTETSKGTKVFALTGDVRNIGLVEVPMGVSLRNIIFDVGGGIPGKKRKFKAVQLGGPSGGCVPEDYIDTPVDYESIAKVGAIMGSGGMIVMDDQTCMVDMARFFMDFIQDESCGKCTPCREGTRRMLEILEKITRGEGEPEDIDLLEELSDMIRDGALCGLGQTGPNPVLSTLQYFRHEYEAHIHDKNCPAKRCPALLSFEVDQEACIKCGLCQKNCPAGAVVWQKKEPAFIDKGKCIKCMSCITNCPSDAIF
jgi:NADH-quinone oxidoreductase subunit F/NAD(P)H dehydrogenase (quinone)/NADP-reducing hydrogenase subunit HndC